MKRLMPVPPEGTYKTLFLNTGRNVKGPGNKIVPERIPNYVTDDRVKEASSIAASLFSNVFLESVLFQKNSFYSKIAELLNLAQLYHETPEYIAPISISPD